jgi:hypothetical protein
LYPFSADLISLLDVNPHNEHPGIILESEFFDEADFALRYSNIQRRVVSARIGNVGKYTKISIISQTIHFFFFLLANNTSAPTVASSAAAAINSSLTESSTLPNPNSTNPPSTTNPSTLVTPTTNTNPTIINPTERDRKRNRYDPRWLDGSLREELFGRIDRELKPDDLSLVKDNNSTKTSSIRKDQNSTSSSQTNPPAYQQQTSASVSLTSSSSTPVQNPIQFGDQLQFWTDFNSENSYPRFTHIAGLYSELIAINTNGQLCQWNWQDDYPYQDLDNPQIKHPKCLILQILNEKIIHLSANIIRASILTETNRLATWIDDSLGSQVNFKFQHSLQELPSPIHLRIIDIQTSPLCTVIRTDTNDLYWYGLLPNKPRKKLLERLKEKTRKNRTNNSTQSQSQSQQQIITIGSSVCLISNPYYNQGALAFYIRDGQPKLGQLMEQAWILSNTARFRIKIPELIINKNKEDDKSSLEMPPPPSPASSTCSVDSNTSFASSLKRKKHSNTTTTTTATTTTAAAAATTTTTNPIGTGSNPFLMTINDSDSNEQQQQHSKIKDEEYWPLDEVIFIEDCKVAPIGKVVKIDGSLVLVKFPSKATDITEANIDINNLENCRILRKDDLQVKFRIFLKLIIEISSLLDCQRK